MKADPRSANFILDPNCRELSQALCLLEDFARRRRIKTAWLFLRDIRADHHRIAAIRMIAKAFPLWSADTVGSLFLCSGSYVRHIIPHKFRASPPVCGLPVRFASTASFQPVSQLRQDLRDSCPKQDHFPSLLPCEQPSHEGEQKCRLITPKTGKPLQELGASS